jgi:hypothetical protein
MPRGRGYTKVDLRHLLEDLRDAYPGGLEETILTELVANSLDAGASTIRVIADPAATTFRLEDDGRGMTWKELKQFHNLAASSKTRGAGIGFAGVGIKLALLAAREVVTESRRGKSHAASRWHLASSEFAPYEPIAPPGNVTEHGTAVLLRLNHGLSPLVDAGYIEHVIRGHFQPLVDPSFAEALAPLYPRGVRFEVNGRALDPARPPTAERAPLEVRIERQRKASGLGHIERHAQPGAESLRGIAISTYGKVIRRGWDWLGILPAAPDRITGILEVPSLSQALTLNKGDFVRTGARGAVYLSYRRAIQEAVQAQLSRWGDARDLAQDTRRKVARPLERDLERVLDGLADEFPLLASLVERQRGGQRRIELKRHPGGAIAAGDAGEPASVVGAASIAAAELATELATDTSVAAAVSTLEYEGGLVGPEASTTRNEPSATTLAPPAPEQPSERDAGSNANVADVNGGGLRAEGTARAQRYGLSLQFEARPGDPEMGRLIENTVWINTDHAAYQRAEATRSTGYHIAVAVALALAPLATGGAGVQQFVTAFLAQWGESVRGEKKGQAARRRGK